MVPLGRMVTVDDRHRPARWSGPPPLGLLPLPVTGPADEVLGYLHIKDTLGVAERDKALSAQRPAPRDPGQRSTPRWTTP